MNILITGVNGFIGRYVAEELSKDPHIIIYGTGRHNSNYLTAGYVSADIRQKDFVETIREVFPRCDVIIHLAASIDLQDGYLSLETNCIGTYNICRLANEWKSEQLIYMSSIPVIGFPNVHPVTEDHEVHPQTIYHVSKYAGEQMLYVVCKENIKKKIVRISSPIGVGMRGNTLLSVILEKCLKRQDIILYGRGKRRQNYVDVRDISQAIEKLLVSEEEGVFYVAGVEAVSNIELAKMCKTLTKTTSNIVFIGKQDKEENCIWDISIKKAQQSFGYYPKFTLEQSICWIYESMRKK